MISSDTIAYNEKLSETDKAICEVLAREIDTHLPEADNKVWHGHPIWFSARESPVRIRLGVLEKIQHSCWIFCTPSRRTASVRAHHEAKRSEKYSWGKSDWGYKRKDPA